MADLPHDVEIIENLEKLNEIIDDTKYSIAHPFFDKISLFYGDITKVEVDAIVTPSNATLVGCATGVNGCIRRAAGERRILAECMKQVRPVLYGEAVITDSCKIRHVDNIIHVVGPVCQVGGVNDERRNQLVSCYRRAMQLSEEISLRTIAFPCISTGRNGYDKKDAAKTIVRFLWNYLNDAHNAREWDRVVLCLFTDIDRRWYKHYIMQLVHDPAFFDRNETTKSGQTRIRPLPFTDFTDSSEQCHDATLIIEGEKIYVSKQYLALHSPFFKAMLYNDFDEKDKKEIELKDIDRMEFIELLDVIYPSRVRVTELNNEFLLKLADQYQIKMVIDQVEDFLISSSNLDISEKLKLSDDYRLAKFQDDCLNSFTTFLDVQKIKNSDGYNSLSDKAKSALMDRAMNLPLS